MAGLSTHEDLRREIQALTVENEELRQLVQLLQENNQLKTSLQSQAHGASRMDSLDASSVESGSFRLPLRLGAAPMTPVGAAAPFRMASTPVTPHTPPAMGMVTPPAGQMFTPSPPPAPRGMHRMQQLPGAPYMAPPVARLNLQSPPRGILRPGSPGDSGLQGAGYMSDSSQDSSFRSGGSSPVRMRGRGYCTDCAVPFHPHLPEHDSVLSGRMNISGHSDNSSFG